LTAIRLGLQVGGKSGERPGAGSQDIEDAEGHGGEHRLRPAKGFAQVEDEGGVRLGTVMAHGS